MYREENGQVILTMSREDYDVVLIALGSYAAELSRSSRRASRGASTGEPSQPGQPALQAVPGGGEEVVSLGSIEDVPMVCDTCGSTFRLGDCEAKDAYDHPGPYEGEIGCPVADCGGTMREFGR